MGTNIGTQLKIALCLDCAGLAMSDYDFTARFFTYSDRYVEVAKADMIEDGGTYIAVVDTSTLSSGELKVTVTATIPDVDCESGYRKEIATARTGITLKKCVSYGVS